MSHPIQISAGDLRWFFPPFHCLYVEAQNWVCEIKWLTSYNANDSPKS